MEGPDESQSQEQKEGWRLVGTREEIENGGLARIPCKFSVWRDEKRSRSGSGDDGKTM